MVSISTHEFWRETIPKYKHFLAPVSTRRHERHRMTSAHTCSITGQEPEFMESRPSVKDKNHAYCALSSEAVH